MSFLSYGSLLFAVVAGAACSAASTSAGPPDGVLPDAGGDASADAHADAPSSYDATPSDAALGVACTGASPAFAKDVEPILQSSCSGGEICHGGIGPAWRYKDLVNVPATRDCATAGVIVTPGDLDKSYLVHKITGVGMCAGSERMPRGGAPLRDAEIQTIADWICKGAPND